MTTHNLTPEQQAEQARILKEGSGHDAFLFARDIPGADLKALEARVLAVGAGQDAYCFAKEIPGADGLDLYLRALSLGVDNQSDLDGWNEFPGELLRMMTTRLLPDFDLTRAANALEEGASADIWYDAHTHGEVTAEEQIEAAQLAMQNVSKWVAQIGPLFAALQRHAPAIENESPPEDAGAELQPSM